MDATSDNDPLALQPPCNAKCVRCGCGKGFVAQRTTARYCSTKCRVSAHRVGKKKAEKLRRVEWYSPAEAVDAALHTMGGIDLDPASCEEANEIVRAACIFTAATNGLLYSWWGRVWLNPPFDKTGQRFIRKLGTEVRNGNVEQACVILFADHLTSKWFHDAVDGLDQILCVIRGRLEFYGPNRRSRPAKGSVVIGFGVSQQRFAEAFSPLGRIVTTSPPKPAGGRPLDEALLFIGSVRSVADR